MYAVAEASHPHDVTEDQDHPITFRVGRGVPVPKKPWRYGMFIPMVAVAVLLTAAMAILAAF